MLTYDYIKCWHHTRHGMCVACHINRTEKEHRTNHVRKWQPFNIPAKNQHVPTVDQARCLFDHSCSSQCQSNTRSGPRQTPPTAGHTATHTKGHTTQQPLQTATAMRRGPLPHTHPPRREHTRHVCASCRSQRLVRGAAAATAVGAQCAPLPLLLAPT